MLYYFTADWIPNDNRNQNIEWSLDHSLVGPQWGIDPDTYRTISVRSTTELSFTPNHLGVTELL